MTLKHTPGPWMVDDCGDTRVIVSCQGHAQLFQEVTGYSDSGCWPAGDEMEGDFQLVVAAPEIADAAAGLLADIHARHPGEELKCPWLRALEAALKKAGVVDA